MSHTHKGTALITGAANRLGRALALSLAHNGYDIIIHYNSSHKNAASLAEEICLIGKKAHLIQQSLSDKKSTDSLWQQASHAASDITLLINNASLFEKESFFETDEMLFIDHQNIHVNVPFFLSQSFARNDTKGNIINMIDSKITSNEGAYFAYLLSKKSMHNLNQMLAKELAPNIRVNAICPNSILPSEHWTQENIDAKNRQLPLQTTPEIKHITDAILHLIDNSALTGQTLYLDSGQQLV